jgi:indole-3-glycerol phosphate synthase
MKDIHEVLRQKQTKYAQLGKQIEMLQQAAEKLREVAPLLAENDDEDNAVLMEVDEASPSSDAMASKAARRFGGAGPKQLDPRRRGGHSLAY